MGCAGTGSVLHVWFQEAQEAQLSEVGPPVPVWNKDKVIWFSEVGTNLALPATGQNITALSTKKMFVPSQSVIWIAVHISDMSVYTTSGGEQCKIKVYWLCSTGINAREESCVQLVPSLWLCRTRPFLDASPRLSLPFKHIWAMQSPLEHLEKSEFSGDSVFWILSEACNN